MIPPRKRRKKFPFSVPQHHCPASPRNKNTLRVFLVPPSCAWRMLASKSPDGPDMLVQELLLRQPMSEGVSRYGTKFECRQKSSLAFCTNARHYTSRGGGPPLSQSRHYKCFNGHIFYKGKKKKTTTALLGNETTPEATSKTQTV